jgi:hypothetical protein
VTLVLRNHRRQECLDSGIVGDCVDAENAADLVRCGFQDVPFKGHASIIDQNARIAVLRTDGFSSGVHSFHRGDVALVVVDLFVRLHLCWEGVVDIKSHYSDTVRREAFRNESTKATAGSGDHCDFLWPVISVFL